MIGQPGGIPPGCLLVPVFQPEPKPSGQPGSGVSQRCAQHRAEEYIAGPVDIQIESGKRDHHSQHQRRFPQPAAAGLQGKHRREGSAGAAESSPRWQIPVSPCHSSSFVRALQRAECYYYTIAPSSFSTFFACNITKFSENSIFLLTASHRRDTIPIKLGSLR